MITSPVSGVIIDKRVDIGQTVVASLNAPSLFLIAKDMKKRGYKFCGPTIVYACMQAVGMVNDHELRCERYKQIQSMY